MTTDLLDRIAPPSFICIPCSTFDHHLCQKSSRSTSHGGFPLPTCICPHPSHRGSK